MRRCIALNATCFSRRSICDFKILRHCVIVVRPVNLIEPSLVAYRHLELYELFPYLRNFCVLITVKDRSCYHGFALAFWSLDNTATCVDVNNYKFSFQR